MRTIVLASTSPFRRELLARLGLPFTAVAPRFEERFDRQEDPAGLAGSLALGKALSLADDYPDEIIIGSDQVLVTAGEIVGKPGSVDRARKQLRRMSGGSHTFHTGLAVVDAASGATRVATVPFTVTMRKLNDREIENYIRLDDPLGCAGSFRIERLGIALMERLEGDDYTALIGLPLIELVSMLRAMGVNPLDP